jgi:hypothetical protein
MISSRNIGFILAVYLPFPWTTRHLIIPQNYLQPIVFVPTFHTLSQVVWINPPKATLQP